MSPKQKPSRTLGPTSRYSYWCLTVDRAGSGQGEQSVGTAWSQTPPPPPGHMRVPPTPWQGISWGILATHHPACGSKSSHLFFFGCTSRCLFPWSNHRLTTWRGGERPRFWPSSPRADHGDQAQQLAVLNSPCRSCPQNRGSSRLQGLHTLKVCNAGCRAVRTEWNFPFIE